MKVRNARTQQHKNTRTQECKNTTTQQHKNTRMQEHKNARTQERKNTRTQEHKHLLDSRGREPDSMRRLLCLFSDSHPSNRPILTAS